MTDTPQNDLRTSITEALTAAAYECDGKCGLAEQECFDAHPITFSAMSNGVTHINASVKAIADVVAAIADAEQAQLRVEVDRLGDWVRAVTERAKTAETAHDRTHDELIVNEADRVAAVNQNEAHRLALSEALDLGTGAPWDAIHERVQELRRLACDHSFPDPFPASLDQIRNCRHCGIPYQDAKQQAQQPSTETPASTAPLAAGLPLIKGNCPACRRASLFLGTGGYPTCSNADCPEPDAATTVLEQYANEAHEPEHSWRVETRDPLANEWAPGSHFRSRPHAIERYDTANRNAPLWKDGTPVERRIVRETTTYTVEQPAAVPGRAADEEQPETPAGIEYRGDCPACRQGADRA
ncbi:hypothetical protein AB0M00_43585 [Streptomyces chartreusis]|uniref:hypothetical protein n=1 Tax=Streptomyces chartreusis TaxID=1969 RepID=UPI0034430327